MSKKIIPIFLLLFLTPLHAFDTHMEYYFGKEVTFDSKVPSPESVLGYQVGEWHVRPEQVAEYMYALAQASDRVWVEETGRTWERRPLMLVSFSSAANIKRLDQIRTANSDIVNRKNEGPAVAWMGYSVHGNEASGANAAILLAYYLAAAQGPEVDKILNDTVVLLDPMINPDGIARFASWVNSHRSMQLVSDPYDIEHNEVWPRGRTNHYWFDLNRDWLLLQHPESRARIKQFHRWKPVVLTDYHEMGTNNTYFFQPGVPSRQNPLTPGQNIELTSRIAEYHGRALDQLGSSYYTKEGFDDFYFGKGSTYPDINGAIGILFEQASARGHVQQSVNGDLTFPFAVRNQLTASLSTLRAVVEMKTPLLKYQQDFYKTALAEADDFKTRAYVYHADGDSTRLKAFNQLFDQHQINYYQLARDIKLNGQTYRKGEAYIVPLQQQQFRLLRTFFETGTRFKDNTFYDVSSWTLALSHNLNFAAVSRSDFSSRLVGKLGMQEDPVSPVVIEPSTIALAIDWQDFAAAPLASKLLAEGFRVRVATKPSQLPTRSGIKDFAPGTLILPFGIQPFERDEIMQRLGELATSAGVEVAQITGGYANGGVDLGSPSMRPMSAPRPLLVIGDGVSGYEAGEVWHLLDTRLNLPVTKVNQRQLASIPLHQYSHLIFVSGRYRLPDSTNDKIYQWVRQGGQLIASRTAGQWLAGQDWSPIKSVEEDNHSNTERKTYAERERHLAEQVIGGAIYQWEIDITHPLAYGVPRKQLPVFRRGTDYYKVEGEPFGVVAQYPAKPLISGFSSSDNQNNIANTPALVAVRKGRGSVIYFADNMNFRAFWWGTARVFANSLYFGNSFQSSAGEDAEAHAHH